MKMQLITSRKFEECDYPHVTISEFDKPLALDEFEVNIIDLNSSELWRTKEQNLKTIDRLADFASIQSMVTHRKIASVVYCLPQDLTFLSHEFSKGPYKKGTRLKDIIPFLEAMIKASYPQTEWFPNLLYEKTRTIIDTRVYNADFYFDQSLNSRSLSELSQKATTVNISDYLYLTTLNIFASEEYLISFIEGILPKQEREVVPVWMESVEFFDDRAQKERIITNNIIIENAQAAIKTAKEKLDANMYYKSILYTNGDELVEVVLSILEKILSCNLSDFEDEKKEDFQIKKDSYTLIGEIKGVTSNIKNEHISQVDVHFQGYLDKLAEEGAKENVHQVLIMNPFRNKPISEREPVHETQIKLAERNGCLIIETMTLLKLFEKFVAGVIDVGTCEKLFTEKTGLLNESDF